VPGSLDYVIIDTNSLNQPILNTTTTIYGLFISTSNVYRSTLTVTYPLTVTGDANLGPKAVFISSTTQLFTITGNLTMQNSSLLEQTQVYGSAATAEVNVSVGGTFDLQAGATIYVDALGYRGATSSSNGTGPGGGQSGSGGGGGGGHGGAGGQGAGGTRFGGS